MMNILRVADSKKIIIELISKRVQAIMNMRMTLSDIELILI
jgi:hypothetical protein